MFEFVMSTFMSCIVKGRVNVPNPVDETEKIGWTNTITIVVDTARIRKAVSKYFAMITVDVRNVFNSAN